MNIEVGESPLSFDSLLLKDEDRASLGKEDTAPIRACLQWTTKSSCPSARMFVCSSPPADVIHAFAMPAFGVKIDAVPGRLNETWFKADREGLYYGQCSELCGKDHAYHADRHPCCQRRQVRHLACCRRDQYR